MCVLSSLLQRSHWEDNKNGGLCRGGARWGEGHRVGSETDSANVILYS